VAWSAPKSCFEVTVVVFREDSFLALGAGADGGLLLEDTGGGAREPLAGDLAGETTGELAGMEPFGGAEDETFIGARGASGILSVAGRTA
jgi:hypothetical protein